MALGLADHLLTTLANAWADEHDVGAGSAEIEIYDGTKPSDPDASITDTLLATIGMPEPAFGAASIISSPMDAGECVLASAVTAETNAAPGTAGWFLCKNGTPTRLHVGTVTATGGGGDMELSTLTIPSGGTVDLTDVRLRVTRNP